LDRSTYKGNHVHHSGIACDKEQESNLDSIGLFDISRLDLLSAELADDIILRLYETLFD
jgi:hypothetical protein